MKSKLYPCNECGTEVKIRSKGLCSFCRNKKKGGVIKQYFIKKQTAKNKERKRNKSQLMKPFWEYHSEEVKKQPFCQNCGVRIQANVANLAHILPKQSHIEVMDDLNNCIYLCSPFDGINCHAKYDRIQATTQVYLMPCFQKALNKYLLFREKVEKYSKYKQIFEDYIEENNE